MMINQTFNKIMKPSPADTLKSALAGGITGPAWLIIGRHEASKKYASDVSY